MITPIILAGGTGSRLWPLSRAMYPKQFLPLINDNTTMLQATFSRLSNITYNSSMVICNDEHRFIVAEQLRQQAITPTILLEPVARNTAPAVALAALYAMKDGNDPVLLVLPADHVIDNKPSFELAIQQALPLAKNGKLVTFGITPTSPETGYGYVKRGVLLADKVSFTVSSFVEKPNLDSANRYINSGEYYWNSGIFMFRASRYLVELSEHRPDILVACEKAITDTVKDFDFVRVGQTAFKQCPEESIDYAVMEKTQDAVLVPLDAGWNDVGSWSALWEIGTKNTDGNIVRGDVLLHDCKNSFVHSSSRLVTMAGMENTILIETQDAILVIAKDHVQDVKKIVKNLKNKGRCEVNVHREVYRPWGKYDSVDTGFRYQVKRITVKPGEKLSTQMHHHRAEHWVVVSGTAKIINGDTELILTENQSTYIPVGVIHSLENPGKIPLEMIEVQSGSYLGEDDIVRLSDRYGRE